MGSEQEKSRLQSSALMHMWRTIALFAIGGVLGTVFGIAVGLFAYPFFFPPPEAMETLTTEEQADLIARGRFIHANPSDPIHYGKGEVSVYANVLHLNTDFEVGPGPAFHVYLVPKEQIRQSSDVRSTMFVDRGSLRALKDSQKYQNTGSTGSKGISECGDLVRSVPRAHISRRFGVRKLRAASIDALTIAEQIDV